MWDEFIIDATAPRTEEAANKYLREKGKKEGGRGREDGMERGRETGKEGGEKKEMRLLHSSKILPQ